MANRLFLISVFLINIQFICSGILNGQEKISGHEAKQEGEEDTPSTCANLEPRELRKLIRSRKFCKSTNGCASGFVQCNLIVLKKEDAEEFKLFCENNQKSCPLLEVCEEGSPFPKKLASDADLRSDLPKYSIYLDGNKVTDIEDVTDYWPEDSVAFLIGCSFSYDAALQAAGINLRSAEQGTNVPMYISNIPCHQVGKFKGNMVVSMKPIKVKDVPLERSITSQYQFAHGQPVHIGEPSLIGIEDINTLDWGETVEILADEVPVFHACGVTPQLILMEAKIPFAITHSPGHMFITDTLCISLISNNIANSVSGK
ncbi:MAG: putative hydro-lyase [Oligoflexales bacterium]